MRSLGVILGAIILLSIAAELAFVRATEPYTQSDFPLVSRAASDFETWEFEDRGGGDYYALAYNSYFYCADFGGVRVQSLRAGLSRSREDDTETVVYYTGSVGGVRGEYIAALARQPDGSYLARLDCDSLEAVRIYPTEQVRSTVRFSGVTLNDAVELNGFQPARMLLWVFIYLSLYVLYRIIAAAVRKEQRPSAWVCVYVFLQTLVLLAAYEATRIFTAVAGMSAPLLIAGFGGFSLLYAAVWVIVCRLRGTALKGAACALVVGTMFVVANAPMQAPDEFTHYLRAEAISHGDFTFDKNHVFPDDVQWLVSSFPGNFQKEVHERGLGSVTGAYRDYFERRGEPFDGDAKSSPVQLLLPYLPAALGIAAARLFGADALISFWAGRFANVLFYAVCVYFALRMAKRRRGALLFLSLLPLTLYMAASYSYDSMLLSALVLLCGALCAEPVGRRELLLFVFLCGFIISLKWLYLPLALLIFLLPKEKFGRANKRPPRWVFCVGAALLGLVFFALAEGFAGLVSNVERIPYPDGVNVSAQIHYVLANPVRYLLTAVIDGYYNTFYLGASGVFGWMDADCALTNLLVPMLFVLIAALYADDGRLQKKLDAPLCGAIALLIYGLVVTGFYCTWSTLGSTSILGVQPRYFLPAVPCLMVLATRLAGGLFPRGTAQAQEAAARLDTAAVYLCAGVCAIAACELLVLYYFT